MTLFALTGCTARQDIFTNFTPPNTPGGRLCLHQCNEARGFCRQRCDLQNRLCLSHMRDQAMKDYQDYALRQFQSREATDFRPSDFERPETCPTATCEEDCQAHYASCYEVCGGHVERSSSCRAFCF